MTSKHSPKTTFSSQISVILNFEGVGRGSAYNPTKTNYTTNLEKINSSKGRPDRLVLERKFVLSGKILPPKSELNLNNSNYEILSKKLIQYRSKTRSLTSKTSRLRQEIKSTKANLKISSEQLKLKRKLEKVQENLYKQKIGSLLKYLSAQDASLNSQLSYLNTENSF